MGAGVSPCRPARSGPFFGSPLGPDEVIGLRPHKTQPDLVQALCGRNQSYRINCGGIDASRLGAVEVVTVLDETD